MPKGIIQKIRQVDYETGEEIEVYETIADAAKDNYTSPKTIRKSLINNGGVIERRKLKFAQIECTKRPTGKKKIPCKRIDINGNTVEYESISKAALENNKSEKAILSAITSGKRKCAGYFWQKA